MPSRRASPFARIVSAAFGLAFGLLGAELTFGRLRPETVPAEPVLYSIEVRDATGALLASPLVVGRDGQRVHLDLSEKRHAEPLQMSLDLDPRKTGPNNVCLEYRLAIDDGFPHSGRVGLAYGEERSVELRGAGESWQLSFVVAKAGSPAYHRLLRGHRKPTA